ncbi:glycosyltransferase family 4 protein [Ferruginibacter lapsinanis]|uniref:glycosyltransferase family 4 protein n=1 Tax=Ferruginibacter lapsinanis TaxID=563172 RepID=UPI001E297C24|nr:glycosyltransferase family 4 protein [Ferruginibacter lapsinanis]UEG50916.1 glycosyltransferase family 4 protein [Ferruginibacter lapsinanis]
MKSVLFLSLMNGSAWGGSEEIWYKTALWMADNNYTVDVCCYDWDEKKSRLSELEKRGGTVHLLPSKKILKSVFGKWKLQQRLKNIPFEKYDFVFINQGSWNDVVYGPLKHLYKRLTSYALCSHNYNVNDTLSKHKTSIYSHWINNACVNMAATEKVFDTIKQNLHITVPKQKVIYNPITFAVPQYITPYPALNNQYIWIMLAELDNYRKAQDILIKTLSTEKWMQRNWVLHLYGKGKDEASLRQLIIDLDLQKKIILKGHTNNVQEALRSCHFLFQITRVDAMPLSVVEAMAMARPCIVSNVGEMPKWVQNGITGFVSEGATIEDIDATLEECWLQRNDWKTLGENAYTVFTEKYPQPYEAKMVELLESYYSK